MKFIEKQRNSVGYRRLLELQKIPDSTYDDVSNNVSKNDFIRNEVLTSLLEEQGYLLRLLHAKNKFIQCFY